MVEKVTNIKLEILCLYRSNYSTSFHVREMAKLLKKSHVTLLPHINELQKDKILILKQVGKNKICTLNLDNVINRNYLILVETTEATKYLEEIFLIKKITTEIFSLKLEGAIVLFGSYAKRTFNKDSDIDLFYLGKISEEQVQEIKNIGKRYGKIINMKISNIKDFDNGLRKKNPLIIEIIKNHISLQNGEHFINSLWRYYDEIRT